MNIALIIAGGSGQRMHQQIPKQFINVNDKPIIVYTLQAFQKHPDIDAICVSEMHQRLARYFKGICPSVRYYQTKMGHQRWRKWPELYSQWHF